MEKITVDKAWFEKVLHVLRRVGKDADKVVFPSKLELDAFDLMKEYEKLQQRQP